MTKEKKVKRVEILQGDLLSINPALDYVQRTAYVGLHLPAKRVIENDGKEQEELTIEHFFVWKNSQEKDIYVTPEDLPEGHILSCSPVQLKNARWQRADIQLWLSTQESVDAIALYNQIRNKAKFYFEFSTESTYDVVTLWSIGSYFYHLFSAYPYLFINGVKRTGKTKLLRFLQQICHNAFLSTSITTASLHRSIQSLRATLLIDEHETFNSKKLNDRMQELRAALLGGNQVGCYALKVEGEKDKRVETYETYSPKALANISGLDDVLEDRCIYILMLRALGNQKNTDINPVDPEWKEICNKLYRFYLESAGEVSELSADSVGIPEGINSRARQLWIPIFTLAKYFENRGMKDLVSVVSEFALHNTAIKASEDEDTNEVLLVRTLKEMVRQEGWYPVSEIKEQFAKNFEDAPKWANSKAIGNMLKRIGLEEKRRVGKGYEYYIKPSRLQELAARYVRADVEICTLSSLDTQSSPSDNREHNAVSEPSEHISAHNQDITPNLPQGIRYDKETGRFVCNACGSWSRDSKWASEHQCTPSNQIGDSHAG